MNPVGISTEPSLLNVELARTLIESPSVSTFLPEEDASIYPLLSNNGNLTPLTFSHPLTPSADYDSNSSNNLDTGNDKVDVNSSSSSTSDFGIDIGRQRIDENATKNLFNKHMYQHFENNNALTQESNGPTTNNTFVLSKDAPCFVSWNWPLIRKVTFLVFFSILLAMCAVVVALVVNLPKSCNPKTKWYRGSVFLEVHSSVFEDSHNDEASDISQIINKVNYFESLGVTALHLNFIPWSANNHYDVKNKTTSMEINNFFRNFNDIETLASILHDRQMYLVLDLPLALFAKKKFISMHGSHQFSNSSELSTEEANFISDLIHKWCSLGIDGFFIKGLHDWTDESSLIFDLSQWRKVLKTEHIFIVSQTELSKLSHKTRNDALNLVDLVDVEINILNGLKGMEKLIKDVLTNDIDPLKENAWVHWSMGTMTRNYVDVNENITLAVTLMQLMLPGTTSIFYDMDNAKTSFQQKYPHETWHPLPVFKNRKSAELIVNMIGLRNNSPSIYKNAICKTKAKLTNTQLHLISNEILIVERTYPRRNTLASISNLSNANFTTDISSFFYSGKQMLVSDPKKVYFQEFEIEPQQTMIVKLDK